MPILRCFTFILGTTFRWFSFHCRRFRILWYVWCKRDCRFNVLFFTL